MIPERRRLLLLSGSSLVSYLLYDKYSATIAAGALNGTLADPTGQVRTATDTGNRYSASSGALQVTSGGGTGDPAIWYPSLTRTAGRMIFVDVFFTSTRNFQIGFNSATSGAPNQGAIFFRNTGTEIDVLIGAATITTGITLSTGITYKGLVITRAAGTYVFAKGGVLTNWTLLWSETSLTTATLYPEVAANAGIGRMDNVRIPANLWLPSPIISDGFSIQATTDGLGHAETTGLGSGGANLTWVDQAASWTVATGAVTNTPTLGSELITNGDMSSDTGWTQGTGWAIAAGTAAHTALGAGDLTQAVLTVGQWYRAVYTLSSFSAGSITALYGTATGPTRTTNATFTETGRCIATTIAGLSATSDSVDTADDVSYKLLTLNSLFRSIQSGPKDAIHDVAITRGLGTQCGLVCNLDSVSSPANFIHAYFDGKDNIVLDKCVAGVYTNVQAATAVTYSAGAVLRVVKSGTSVTVYYNNAIVGAIRTISDAGIINNTNHSLFSTSSVNSFDNYVVRARGTSNEYSELDKY